MVVNRIQLLEQCWEMELGHPWLSVTGHLILESHDPFFRAGGDVVVYTQNKSTERIREREPARINPRYLGDNHGGRILSLLLCSSCQKKVPVSIVSLRRDSDTWALIPGGSKDLWEPIKRFLFYLSNKTPPFFPKNAQVTLENPSLDIYPPRLEDTLACSHTQHNLTNPDFGIKHAYPIYWLSSPYRSILFFCLLKRFCNHG